MKPYLRILFVIGITAICTNLFAQPSNHKMNKGDKRYYDFSRIDSSSNSIPAKQLLNTYRIPLRTNTPVTWLSIPRHIRNTSPDLTSTSIAFAQDNFSDEYSYLNLQYNDPEPGSPYALEIVEAEWEPIIKWTFDDGMEDIHSARGYKLAVEIQEPLMTPYIELEGTVQDPYTPIDLLCHEENWIGYFLYEEQFVLDAIAPIKPDVYHIMHQDFVCYRYNFITTDCHSKSTNGPTPGTWICGAGTNIKYGDMVIIKAGTDISGFQWQSSGNPPDQSTRSAPEYFEYEEEISYTTILIELDTTAENPQEIGAFVNDTCIGACSVIETDSVVIMRAYLGEQPGDSVVFEEYSSAKSTTNNRINDYFVLNPENRVKERRAIKTGESSNVFTVSFRKEVENKITATKGIELNIFPNPAKNMVNIGYTLESDGTALIEIFDNMGRKLRSVSTADQASGSYSLQYELTDGRGVKLEPGIYLFRLTACGQTISKKLVVK